MQMSNPDIVTRSISHRLASRISAMCLARNMSSSDLARHSGVSETTVSKIRQYAEMEASDKYYVPSMRTLTKIALGFNVSFALFMNPSRNKPLNITRTTHTVD